MTSNTWEDRKVGYSGLNTPSRVITTYQVNSGSLEEHYFKMFLKKRNIPIVYGEEFFKFDGGIDILLVDFMNMDKSQHPTFIEHSKELIKKTTLNNYHKDKNTDKYKCEVCEKRHGNKSALTSHNGSKKHKNKITNKIVEDLVKEAVDNIVRELMTIKQPKPTYISDSESDITMEEDDSTYEPSLEEESSEDESMGSCYYDNRNGDLVITDGTSPYETDRMMIGDVMDYEEDETIYI